MRFQRGRALADRQHLRGQAVRRLASRLDRAGGDLVELDQLGLDAVAHRFLQRRAGRLAELAGAFGNDLGDGFAGAFGRMGGGLAHLDQRGDQRRAGFVRQPTRLPSLAAAMAALSSDSRCSAWLTPRSTEVISAASRSCCASTFDAPDSIRFAASIAASRICSTLGRAASAEASIRAAPASASPRVDAHLALQHLAELVEAFAQALRCGRQGHRGWYPVPAVVADSCLQLGTKPPKCRLDMIGALVARAGKVEEPLVERGEAGVEVGHQPLRGTFLLGNPRRQARQARHRRWPAARRAVRTHRSRRGRCPPGFARPTPKPRPPGRRSRYGFRQAPRPTGQAARRPSRGSLRPPPKRAARGARPALSIWVRLASSRSRRLADDRVGLLRLCSKLADLGFEAAGLLDRRAAGFAQRLGHAPGAILGLRQVGEQHADVGPCGLGRAVERRAMFGQGPRSLVEFAR